MEKRITIECEGVNGVSEKTEIKIKGMTNIQAIGYLRFYEKLLFTKQLEHDEEDKTKKDIHK